MVSNRSGKAFFSKTFALFLITGLGFIGYGAYIYIQDMQNDPQTTPTAVNNNSVADQATVVTNDENSSDTTIRKTEAAEIDKEHSRLDELLENQVKTQSVEAETSNELTPENLQQTLLIMFSRYQASEKTLSLALTFGLPSKQSIDNCKIFIQSSSKQIAKEAPVVNHPNDKTMAGCRFNNIKLEDLNMPSSKQIWNIQIGLYDKNNQSLALIHKSVDSLEKLNNLNN